MHPWVESSGYNESVARGTYFRNYIACQTSNCYLDKFVCPETEDFDRHQEQQYVALPDGAVNFRANANNEC